jgi:hypothetical protein
MEPCPGQGRRRGGCGCKDILSSERGKKEASWGGFPVTAVGGRAGTGKKASWFSQENRGRCVS